MNGPNEAQRLILKVRVPLSIGPKQNCYLLAHDQ